MNDKNPSRKSVSNDRLRVGVAGVGHLGSIHASLWKEVAGAALVGVFDTDGAAVERVSRAGGVRAFASLDELLANVDAVSIVTPTSCHYGIALRALNAGKHCLVEKPIASTVQQAKEIASLAARMNVKIQVGHIERFNPALLALEKIIRHPLFIESHRLAQFTPRATDVAVVHDLMIHDIDVILSLVQSPVEQIDANGVAIVSDAADIANARIRFANGCVANVTASRISQRPMRKMRIFQSDAYISIDFAQPVVEIFRLADPAALAAGAPTMLLGQIEKAKQKQTIVYEQPEIPKINALRRELELFRDAIINDTIPVVTADEGTQALEVAEEIMQKIKSGATGAA